MYFNHSSTAPTLDGLLKGYDIQKRAEVKKLYDDYLISAHDEPALRTECLRLANVVRNQKILCEIILPVLTLLSVICTLATLGSFIDGVFRLARFGLRDFGLVDGYPAMAMLFSIAIRIIAGGHLNAKLSKAYACLHVLDLIEYDNHYREPNEISVENKRNTSPRQKRKK